MGSVAHEANRDLKDHQFQIAQLIGNGQAYDNLYLAAQEKSEEVERLYREIDQAYADAADDDEFV